MIAITDVEIVNHGPEGEQYFQGCGTSGTEHTHVVTGCGDTLREALEDALNQAADAPDGGPYATLERHVKAFKRGWWGGARQDEVDRALDASCHARHAHVCLHCDEPLAMDPNGTWCHSATSECQHDKPALACEDCEVHHYASIRWTVETVEVTLDNEDHTDGQVLVTLPQGEEYTEAADDDQTIDGSTWEDSGDYSPYTLLTDRASLVADLRKDGYQLDLSRYADPTEKEIPCASCGAEFILANARCREEDGALVCSDDCKPRYFASVTDKDGQTHDVEATSLRVLADLVNDVNPNAHVEALDAPGFRKGWVGPRGDWRAS